MIRIFLGILLALSLAGCAGDLPKSVAGGECKIFERPKYAVRGATTYDQAVADNFVESGVGGCKWERPEPRPPALDAPSLSPKAKAAHAKKRPSFLRRIRNRFTHQPPPPDTRPADNLTPADVLPEPAPVAEQPPAPPPPPAPRDPVEQLLDRSGPFIRKP